MAAIETKSAYEAHTIKAAIYFRGNIIFIDKASFSFDI